jgi:hypothetical protein
VLRFSIFAWCYSLGPELLGRHGRHGRHSVESKGLLTGSKYRVAAPRKLLKIVLLDESKVVAAVTTLYFSSIDARRTAVQSRHMQVGFTRPFGYRYLAALVSTALAMAPAMAASSYQRALGTVAEADRARLGSGCAVNGATVYVGDVVATDNQGVLRLRLGTGQLSLSAASSASLEEHAGLATVTLAKGSASFSLPDPTQFELETPAGTLRGSGTRATRGQVAIHNAHEIVVTASHGDLVLDNDGDFYTILEGKSFLIVIEEASNSGGASGDAPKSTQHRKHKLLFFSIAGGALFAATVELWHIGAESQYQPD